MGSRDEVMIRVDKVSKRFCRDLKTSLFYGIQDVAKEFIPWSTNEPEALRKGEFWANRDISFEIKRGESVGLIGHNGAGKTTLLKMLNGLIKPDEGEISMKGRVGALIALGAGFNPILTGRENVYANGSILGLSRGEIREKFDEIVEFAELEDAIDAPVQNYSSGMQVRLGFSIAAATLPDVLLIDEVLAVGDIKFRAKCYKFTQEVVNRGGSVILVTHSFPHVMSYCNRALLMDKGELLIDDVPSKAVEMAIELQLENKEASGVHDVDREAIQSESGLRIKGVKITAKDNGDAILGESMQVSVEVEAGQPLDEVYLNFQIFNQENSFQIFSGNSRVDERTFSIPAGVSTIEAQTSPIPLVPRVYSIRVECGVADTVHRDFLGHEGEKPVWFRVRPGDDSKGQIFAAAGADIAWMDVEWGGDQ